MLNDTTTFKAGLIHCTYYETARVKA